jgi:hypothetical protein
VCAGAYLEERYLPFTESMPFISPDQTWLPDFSNVTFLRHVTADEDASIFFAGVYGDIRTNSVTTPSTEQAWSGILVNGEGLATPIDPLSKARLGPDKGTPFVLRVEKGQSYSKTGYRNSFVIRAPLAPIEWPGAAQSHCWRAWMMGED